MKPEKEEEICVETARSDSRSSRNFMAAPINLGDSA
jgi:hypothetical protein